MSYKQTLLLSGIILSGLSQWTHAGLLALSQAPLSVSTTVQPNVMLLIDNSGSMNNIIYDAAFFDPNIDRSLQTEWQYRNSSGNWVQISNSSGNFFLSSLRQGGCSSGYDQFRNSSNTGITKCLRLPDPVGSGNTRYSGEYLNYLANTYANNTDLSSGTVPNETRMMVARDVAGDVLDNTPGMRFGISSFFGPSSHSYGHGATIDRVCGSSITDIKSSLAGYTASTNTPLSEALYEITRYFRGLSSYYHSSTTYTSPIQYRCQKNFTLAITDGFPTQDNNFPNNDPDVPSGKTLSDWDEQHPVTNQSDYPNFPQYSDGYNANQTGEGATLYLDDIAKFAWDIDFKNSSALDQAGVSFNDAGFQKQNMYTYTVGFATQNQMLQDAAEYGNGAYYTATNAAQLTTVLRSALAEISRKSGSSSSAAANTGRIQSGTRVYQARFNSANWSGQLLAFNIDTDKTSSTYGDVLLNPSTAFGEVFDAATLIPAWNSRKIVTALPDATTGNLVGKPFRWGQFTTAEKSSYLNSQQAMLQYLRGRNDSDASIDVSAYRSRTINLGDIVHSTPYFVGKPDARYRDSFEAQPYSAFVSTHANRQQLLYVGANDGMLHAFDAQTGVEQLAFIPNKVLGKLKNLTDPNYNHEYFVDGSPVVVDAFDASADAWKTVLVGGLNAGGQGVYALDITDPSIFSESNASRIFMWEFTDQNDTDMGYSYSQPRIVKLKDGKWYAVFGNGYNNTEADGRASGTGNAVIYIVDLFTGALKKKISTNVGTAQDPTGGSRPNGFATLTPVDLNGDFVAEYIYGGDLFGNVWKFDVDDSDHNNWALDYKLFTACSANTCSASNRQPITTAVTVGGTRSGRDLMVYFGTGKYLETGDNNGVNGGVQSIYGIIDSGASVSGRSVLLQQSITVETEVQVTNKNGTLTTSDDYQEMVPLRKTSNNYMQLNHKGWYLDLVPPAGARGERQISSPALRSGRLIFVTNIPANDPCSPGGDSWLMTLDAYSGGRANHTYDVDNSNSFDAGDKVMPDTSGSTAATGIKVGSGGNSPSFMPGQGADKVVISGNNALETYDLDPSANVNRQSWQQLRN